MIVSYILFSLMQYSCAYSNYLTYLQLFNLLYINHTTFFSKYSVININYLIINTAILSTVSCDCVLSDLTRKETRSDVRVFIILFYCTIIIIFFLYCT